MLGIMHCVPPPESNAESSWSQRGHPMSLATAKAAEAAVTCPANSRPIVSAPKESPRIVSCSLSTNCPLTQPRHRR